MAKPRTAIQLIAVLDRELSWRRTDLLFGLRLVERAKGTEADSAVRAAIPLLYAHWEGFVKKAASHYADFISAQRLRFQDVQISFAGLKAHGYVTTMSEVKKRIFVTSELLTSLKAIESERVSINIAPYIDRMGNLNHNMLIQIVQFFSLPTNNYESFGPLIDEALLGHRNKIAHGEFLDVSAGRYTDMHHEVVSLIERFKSDLEDAAVGKTYRRA